MRAALGFVLGPALLFSQGIASRGVKPAPRGAFSGLPWNARFTDIAHQAGLRSPSLYGSDAKVDYLLESSSGGVAFIDFDNDGWPDVFLVGGPESTNRLYRNQRDGTFVDVTGKAGLRSSGWASGVAVGDIDNDGFDDLFVTYWGQNRLYRNNGDGTFTDITEKAGLASTGKPWGAGATFLDYDRDGHLDLFVSNYAGFDPARVPKPGANAFCNWKGIAVACGPRGLPLSSHILYRNDNGRFTDVSVASGIAAAQKTYGMTAVAADFDDDGWPDIYVASDSTPSLFFHNLKNGRFREEGIERGVALNEDGREQAGMGLGIGDVNLDGRLDIFKTHFADDTHTLYLNEGAGYFRAVTLASGLAVETRYVGWGAHIADFDNDGLPDIFFVTGHVYVETQKELPAYPYRSPRFLDLDILIWNRNEPPSLLRNDLRGSAHWLRIKLAPTVSNRSAIGTRVTVSYGARRQVQEVLSQSSFYSASDRRLHFGLGAATAAKIEVRWPSGRIQRLAQSPVDREILVKEE
ncbi:MAG: CRTAC1 family protein [Acidobacteria bacterium]|nr:CRTAC1 family protein [Acidobacteriota bacterium]